MVLLQSKRRVLYVAWLRNTFENGGFLERDGYLTGAASYSYSLISASVCCVSKMLHNTLLRRDLVYIGTDRTHNNVNLAGTVRIADLQADLLQDYDDQSFYTIRSDSQLHWPQGLLHCHTCQGMRGSEQQ